MEFHTGDVVTQVIASWRAQGITLSKGNTHAELEYFERRYGVHLPEDLRLYFSSVDGMLDIAGSDCDSNGFRFWPLADVKPVTVVCETYGVPLPEAQQLDKHFIFVDYMQWSWAYAIDLSSVAEGEHTIIHVGTLQHKTVARSFTEFLKLYLKDDTQLDVMAKDAMGEN